MASTVINGQTCLEKRGIVERDKEIRENVYKSKLLVPGKEYSPTHQNAKSTPEAPGAEGMKGKSTGGGGHLYFQGYYGKPRGTENAINYSNFVTFEEAGVTIGNRADVDKRKELYITRRYNGYGDNYYSSSHPDAMSNGDIIGKGTGIELDTTNGGGAYDVRLREEHLEQNVWKKDVIEYTKPLVLAEYQVQTEFKVGTYDEKVYSEEKKQVAETTSDGGNKNRARGSQLSTIKEQPGVDKGAQPDGAKKQPTMPKEQSKKPSGTNPIATITQEDVNNAYGAVINWLRK